ncbi:MAG: hypothetical protein EAZ53_04165 [Bacteroidetes bacterium]|nr:MAG: hypothetical protein EAZ53_04165 [Bacteroidota bacterium]
MLEKIINLLIDKPEILVTILSGFLLPVILVWLNNYYNLKQKDREKQLDVKYNTQSEQKNQERAVYSSLSKILFDVQQLHVSLSGTCIDKNCIENALTKFDTSVTKYHEEISNNLLYMPSKVIDLIYKFYSKISDLKIALKEFNNTKNYEMAHVSVYMDSSELAEILIDIQEYFILKDDKLVKDFDKTQQEMMRYCCGRKPPQDLFGKYLVLLKQIKPNLTNDEIDGLTRSWKL